MLLNWAKKIFLHGLLSGYFLMVLLVSYAMADGACGGTTLTITGPDAPVNGSQYTASEGTAPYYWCISKGSINSSGTVAVSGQCGTALITVTDSCGNKGTKKVRMPYGQWVHIDNGYGATTSGYTGMICVNWGATCLSNPHYSGGYRYQYQFAGNCGGGSTIPWIMATVEDKAILAGDCSIFPSVTSMGS